jgi:hypothetical protein
MTHDERLVPARDGRDLDRSLAELTQAKPYGRYGNTSTDLNLREYLYVVLQRKWLIASMVLVITSLATIQAYREPSISKAPPRLRSNKRRRASCSPEPAAGLSSDRMTRTFGERS